MAKLPEFKTEQELADFLDTHDSTDYFDGTEEIDVRFEFTQPKKQPISLRLEPATVARLKEIARARGIGYQTLIRMWLMERLATEPQPTLPPRG
jgi:predicted DNA binding CopG/RHH family protein